MKNKKRYAVIYDNQGGEFGMYRLYTAKEWKQQAWEWANFDDMDGLMEEIENAKEEELIDTISEIWDLEFKEIDINKWCWDNRTNELVLYNESNNTLKELFVIKNFTEKDYKELPQEDYACLDKIIERLNEYWWRLCGYDEQKTLVETTIFD